MFNQSINQSKDIRIHSDISLLLENQRCMFIKDPLSQPSPLNETESAINSLNVITGEDNSISQNDLWPTDDSSHTGMVLLCTSHIKRVKTCHDS